MTEEDWDLVMRVHMKGTFCCSSHALRHWRAQFKQSGKPANGRIINTVSGAMFGNVGQSNYGAAKAGIMGYTIGLALECAQMGVTVNAIGPGPTWSFGTPSRRSCAPPAASSTRWPTWWWR